MKVWLGGVAVVFCAMGIVWILQGTGALPYGGMANKIQWAFLGQALVTVGVGAFVIASLRTAPSPRNARGSRP